ncbi:MAG TPA: hypothetical protein VL283_00260 [Candidatus Baltobacteraceae bacterium]|nr:hypothetical protein [Candidatus Baltobacteraceae bacterium]
MGHPMESHYDAMRAERDRLWARRDAMEERIKPMPLSAFTFAQFADLQMLADRSAPGERASDLVKALDRFDAFLAAKEKERIKKPLKAKPRRRPA